MKYLGEVLIDSQKITKQQLAIALKEQKQTGELMGNVLVRLGMITGKDLSWAMAESVDIPFIDLKQTQIQGDAVLSIPKEMAKKYKAMPFALEDSTLRVALENPNNVTAIDAIRRQTGLTVEIFAADNEGVQDAIEFYYEVGLSLDDEIAKNISAALSGTVAEGEVAPPIVRLVDLFVIKAIRDIATDVHITPEEMVTRVSLRVDGILRNETTLPKALHTPLVTRVKIMSNLNIAEQRLPQDGNIEFQFSGRTVDIRSSTSPCYHGENVVLRILDKTNVVLGLGYLGLDEQDQKVLKHLVRIPHGIVLATGPTGSGKTTTLYSMLKEIDAMEKNVLTIEDPIEYRLPLIKQSQVNEQAGLTFIRAIRHFLRQDPDVILVGEIRDLETARTAFQAAMTGHLVLSTLHTNDATSALARLMDLGVEPYLIPSSLRAVIAQRLLRKICTACAREYVPSQEELQEYELENWEGAGKTLKHGVGCDACDGTGYRGRTGIFEMLRITPEISRMITRKESADLIQIEAEKQGMRTLRSYALQRVLAGVTTLEEAFRVTM
jgi:type IV pilus assembly protein PilB